MYTGFYTLASGLLTNQRQIDIVGNNLLQSQTPGYRGEIGLYGSFEAYLNLPDIGVQEENMGLITLMDDVQTMYHSGIVEFTERTLDVAINGGGFFQIEGTDGNVWLTRNGQFDRSADGYLVLLGTNHRVLDENGQAIPLPSADMTVYHGGEIYDNTTGEYVATLAVGVPAANEDLLRLENDMFVLVDGAALGAKDGTTEILQHYLEGSNVDLNTELTRLIDIQRSFEACSSALQIIDGINQKAASRLGSLS